MKNSIVIMEDNDLWVGTWDLSKGFNIEHRYFKQLIEKYMSEFKEFGPIKTRGIKKDENLPTDSLLIQVMNMPKKRGGQVFEYVINEEQYVFLGTLCKNTANSIKFKKALTKEFFRMRKVLIKLTIQKQNQDWLEKRKSGIIERRYETDSIQDLEKYAKDQGSKNSKMYYVAITKMQNQSLFAKQCMENPGTNLRDILDGSDLELMKISDKIVKQAISECIKSEMHYKDIFPVLKTKIEGLSLSIGRTPLRLMEKTKEIA